MILFCQFNILVDDFRNYCCRAEVKHDLISQNDYLFGLGTFYNHLNHTKPSLPPMKSHSPISHITATEETADGKANNMCSDCIHLDSQILSHEDAVAHKV